MTETTEKDLEIPEELAAILEAYLTQNLSLDVEGHSEYVGGMDSSNLYKTAYTVRLMLGGQEISSAYLP